MSDESGGASLKVGGLGVDGCEGGLEGGEDGESGIGRREKGVAGGQVRM